jgi:hypothetical protein
MAACAKFTLQLFRQIIQLSLVVTRQFFLCGSIDAEQLLKQDDATGQKPFLSSFRFTFPKAVFACLEYPRFFITLEFQAGVVE